MTDDNNHPLLDEKDVIELDGVKFTRQKTGSYRDRFRAFSSMQEYHIETVLRHLDDGRVHRTTTFFDKYGNVTNRVSKMLDTELDSLDRKNVKTIINNYMMNEAHIERR